MGFRVVGLGSKVEASKDVYRGLIFVVTYAVRGCRVRSQD